VAEGASVVDGAIGNRVDLLRSALERHAGAMGTTLRQQSEQLETTLVQGLDAMRRNTDTVTQQTSQTVNGISAQGRMLKDVSEGMLGQLQNILERFDQQNRAAVQVTNALEASQGRLAGTSRDVTGQLGKLAQDINAMTANVQSNLNQLPAAARDLTGQFGKLSQDVNAMSANVNAHLNQLPNAARESASGVRLALQDQIRALDQLTNVSNEARTLRDVMPAEGHDLVARRVPPSQFLPPVSQPAAAAVSSLAASGRDGWSLGDLLARASLDETDSAPVTQSRSAGIDLSAIATAIDPMTAATSWARHRIGERGVITRAIYTSAGQQTFDQISARLRIDSDFRNMADRYIADFERVLTQAEQRDPTGQSLLSQMQTETGRVFLLLAHASGRVGQ
jgi:outer membrane murein-binding lipoprotein Lpp